MKTLLMSLGLCLAISSTSIAQLYSSGNNVITGNNIGIGTNTPIANLHSKTSATTNLTIFENTLNSGTTRMNFQANGATNYTTIQKRGSNLAGNAGVSSMPLANLFSFGNNLGGMLLNSQGNMGIAPTISGVLQYKFLTDTLSGNVGLAGNAIPTARVHVNNTQSTIANLKVSNNTTGHLAGDGLEILINGNLASIMNKENASLTLGTNNIERLKIDGNGNVIIGTTTTPAGYKLFVEGGILTEKLKVAIKSGSQWADYVFADNYELKPLTQVADFVTKNKHLQGIPSSNDVVNQGLDLAAMDAKLLEKVEELTLYLIKMQSEIDALKSKNAVLEAKLNKK